MTRMISWTLLAALALTGCMSAATREAYQSFRHEYEAMHNYRYSLAEEPRARDAALQACTHDDTARARLTAQVEAQPDVPMPEVVRLAWSHVRACLVARGWQ